MQNSDIIKAVAAKLASNPEKRSRDICSEVNISQPALLAAYAVIRSTPKLHQLLLGGTGGGNIVIDGGIRFYLQRPQWLRTLLQRGAVYRSGVTLDKPPEECRLTTRRPINGSKTCIHASNQRSPPSQTRPPAVDP